MSLQARPSLATKKSNMRPSTMRPPPSRAQTATPTLNGRATPSESITSTAKSPARSVNGGTKRKERDFEQEPEEETNINVVVRCRGRNDREVRENSGVVVSTEGVKGKKLDLSMGPSALSNKTYQFDKVFSPAATQEMIFQEVVSPILDEVISGYNCTLFAYGQTGTGKTYTMSGDITDMQPLPEAAGIIPRVLHSLFERIGDDDGEKAVKCSFIELYNEELRDLLSQEENAKLKIYDDNSKKGQTTTLVQGMEESHIKSASKGIELLRNGSHKRQVAATKCNDLSSRSHTVFTVTVFMKRTSETGEDFVSTGKLNLVDLAGSENIQRSGAENKRAAEAGLINKSLLTLGRVINALVERSSHIPYRESKLTRLLQDSLGGRTKTCIIATLSPAKSNLEETISTLDYAFRAKNIKNKPQANQVTSKKTLLKEFTAEIEKLKGELMATRQRNGIYLTLESYEEITTESESRRILSEEQRDKIDIMETGLRNKVEELFTLTNNFSSLKKDTEAAKIILNGTKSLLEKTEVVLAHTRKSLSEETYLRKAHQHTEERLVDVGNDLLSTLGTTTKDINGLHSKLRRRSDLQSANRDQWSSKRARVVDTTEVVDDRLDRLKQQQETLLTELAARMQAYVVDELREVQQSQRFLQSKAEAFKNSEQEVNVQTAKARDDMNSVLGEIKHLRADVKDKVGAGLDDLSTAAQRISAGIASELESFHTQLHGSFASLGKEFKCIFDDVIKQMNDQRAEVQQLREQIAAANATFVQANNETFVTLQQAMDEERQKSAVERQHLLSQIGALITTSAEVQDRRIADHLTNTSKRIESTEEEHHAAQEDFETGMSGWSARSQNLVDSCIKSRENVKAKIKGYWSAANETTGKIKRTTEAVHEETVNIVDAQMAHMDSQLLALDEIISRVRAQNEQHHDSHTQSLAQLSSSVVESYTSIGAHMSTSYDRTQNLDTDMRDRTTALVSTVKEISPSGDVRSTLHTLRSTIAESDLIEYVPTGQTPAKTVYAYPTTLPRTASHDQMLERLRSGSSSDSPTKPPSSPRKIHSSPSKAAVYNDAPSRLSASSAPSERTSTPVLSTASLPAPNSAPKTTTSGTTAIHAMPGHSLRELDPNTLPSVASAPGSALPTPTEEKMVSLDVKNFQPPLKRANTTQERETRLPTKRAARVTVAGVAEGRENVGAGGAAGRARRLRGRGSD